MHVCMLLPERFPPDIRVRKEASALRAAGHSITLLCRGGPTEQSFARLDGIDVERLPADRLFAGLSGMIDGLRYVASAVHPAWQRAVRELDRQNPIDALHIHDLPLVQTGLALGEELDVPVVADLHENYPEAARQIQQMRGWGEIARDPEALVQRVAFAPWRLKRLERECVRRADRTVTVCEEARAHYIRDCDAEPADVTVVSNTVDLDAFAGDVEPPTTLDHDPDSFVVSYVGNFTRHRGLDTLVEGFAQLVEESPDAELLLVGTGNDNYVAGLKALARSLGVREQVTFTGWVDFADVPRYLAASDVSAVPHAATAHTETTVPHKLFQAMAMGVPVVASDVAPLARIVGRTDCGLVTPAGDGDALGTALTELTEEDRASDCGENGRAAVEDEYNWARDGQRLCTLYDGLRAEG
ncbi:glycosyltransferase family 4 protein [Halococcus thailandensis]|uniref:Glycosyltransferase n=1 Tax=Halococcus thailandensis JCM 13552 TaxID=1227457 RepID=M0MXG6_9EURY|nr:glycosyltransferase family 4 protein [Halococcus thailandensis]EMA49514.1 glycosyltransferase [Halococcus thailandensis JCM 13552]